KINAGDTLISINGNEIEDVLDYMFYAAETVVTLKIQMGDKVQDIRVRKSEYDDLGLEFETFLMDNKRRCHNNCVFCFIDQMPPNMRETLYFKDDDARLSFLQGNYVTLTNLNQHDIDRIIKMHLNINVSVHTTNPELRCKMMHNRFAGEKLDYIFQLGKAGIMMNCQIVLCPNLNDGIELERTLTDLSTIMPSIQSVAVVPVGLSKFRDNLFPLEIFNKETATAALDIMERFQEKFLDEFGTRLIFPADEFYLKAEREIPPAENYEDYPQYENGVGMVRSLTDEVEQAFKLVEYSDTPRKISLATGAAAYNLISNIVEKSKEMWHNLDCEVYQIINHYFGENVVVAGLITGQDLIAQLKGKDLGEKLLIPSAMIKKDSDLFLDDITISQVEKELSVKVKTVENDGYALLDSILGIEN
ncbi:MAG: DUF512 domain-containing protein, partial [Oscillospiraceae bacterium]